VPPAPRPQARSRIAETPSRSEAPSRKAPRLWLVLGLLLAVAGAGAAIVIFAIDGDKRAAGKLDVYNLAPLRVSFNAPVIGDPVQQVVGATVTEALSRRGATVSPTNDTDPHKALVDGVTDMYVDTDNHAWEALGNLVAGDPGPFFAKLSAADLGNGVVWLGPAPAGLGPGIAISDAPQNGGVVSLQDLADSIRASRGERKLCADKSEFGDATQLATALGLDPAATVDEVADDGLARASASDRCAGAYVRQRTDERLVGLSVRFLVDTEKKLPLAQIGVAIRESVVAAQPDMSQMITEILTALDERQLPELAKRVSNGEQPDAVAKSWLYTNGFL